MVAKNKDLHGFVPESASIALLIIDVINTMEFEGADKLVKNALPMAKSIVKLKKEAKELKIPIIYANDNFGRWRSDFKALIEYCSEEKCLNKSITKMILPDDDDYFVLKPKHSAFFNTNLDLLLKYLNVQGLIVTGMAGNMCVLFSIVDAYMRDFVIYAPSDCIASINKKDNNETLKFISKIMSIDTTPSDKLDLKKMIKTVGKLNKAVK